MSTNGSGLYLQLQRLDKLKRGWVTRIHCMQLFTIPWKVLKSFEKSWKVKEWHRSIAYNSSLFFYFTFRLCPSLFFSSSIFLQGLIQAEVVYAMYRVHCTQEFNFCQHDKKCLSTPLWAMPVTEYGSTWLETQLWNLFEIIVKFGQNCDILPIMWIVVTILMFGWDCVMLLTLWNWIEILQFGWLEWFCMVRYGSV